MRQRSSHIILNIPKFSHISAAIRDELHWLPIRRRIDFKIALMVRHCLVGAAPEYLMELLAQPSVDNVFGRPLVVTSLFRGFGFKHSAIGPSLSRAPKFGTLPLGIRQSRDNLLLFKRKLKAHLFQQF